jgi:hypothetical protein
VTVVTVVGATLVAEARDDLHVLSYIPAVLLVVGMVYVFLRVKRRLDAEKAERKASEAELVCPHCGTKGKVNTEVTRVKRGVSGGKATGAILTLGTSLLLTGLSRKEPAIKAKCGHCKMTWLVPTG